MLTARSNLHRCVWRGQCVCVFSIFLFGVEKKNLFSVKVSVEFQRVSSDYSCKWPLLTHRHMAFQISFSAPMISSAVKTTEHNLYWSGHRSTQLQRKSSSCSACRHRNSPVLTVLDNFSFPCCPKPFAVAME